MIESGCSNKIILQYFCGDNITKRDKKERDIMIRF